MDVRGLVKLFFLKNGFVLDKASEKKDVIELIDLIRAHIVPVNLIRIGGSSDGGYLVPDDLEGISVCFSAGVGPTSDFEDELSRDYGIKCFLADASVDGPAKENTLFEFDKLFLGSTDKGNKITLGQWMHDKGINEDDNNLLLQMDIEGSEYEFLAEVDSSTLSKYRCIVMELHEMEKLFDRTMLKVFEAFFNKIFKNFSIAHMHPNNCSSIWEIDGVEIPRYLEITFIRNDRVKGVLSNNEISFPHKLDKVNILDKEDVIMPKNWVTIQDSAP
jgi:hypothetical protein